MSAISDSALDRKRKYNRERSRALRDAQTEDEHDEELRQRRKYEANNREHINELWMANYVPDYDAALRKPFIGWDGEGYSNFVCHPNGTVEPKHHYMLFGCSAFPDDPIVGHDLSTQACLDYLLSVERQYPNAIHVGFSFEYDVNMILRDLSPNQLRHLADYGTTLWHNFRIWYIPKKMFRATKLSKQGNETVTIFDVFGFFHSKYTTSLIKYAVASEELIATIEEGKDKRGDFTWYDLDYVREYWQLEISCFVPLMDKIREMCWDADLCISQWHGPGALASAILRKHGVKEWKSNPKTVPDEVKIATQYGFAGGRFQYWQCGLWMHPVYTADINSAYIYACSLLPRLDNGRWVRKPKGTVDRGNIARFGIYHISYDAGFDATRAHHKAGECEDVFPLFHRDKRNSISWPHRTEGWYWSPEAQTVADDPNAEFVEAWVYEDDGTYPFDWVTEEFDKRLELQHDNNPAEKIIKWALAAVYGAFAQRVGWDKEKRLPPKSHELAWAGFITSWCRAEMYKVARECRRNNGLISIDTDGITATVPFEAEWLDRGVGEELGQWKLVPFAGILYWGSGFYWLMDADGNWSTSKSRGFPKGSINVKDAFAALENSCYEDKRGKLKMATITKTQTRFIHFKEALQSRNGMRNWRLWTKGSHDLYMGRGGQTWHAFKSCPKCRNPELDAMHTVTHTTFNSTAFHSPLSYPHKLPWLEPQNKLPENMLEIPEELLIVRDSDEADHMLWTI